MYKTRRGIACIINVFLAVGQTDRNGTDTDRNRLKLLFEQLHFDVRVFNDGDDLSARVSYLHVMSKTCFMPVYLSGMP